MSQHDYQIANAPGATVRADINALAGALASLNGGTAAPTVTFPHMIWYDEGFNILKLRDPTNTFWITLATFQGSDTVWQIGTTLNFHDDAPNTVTRATIQRAAGVNGTLTITNTGTGDFNVALGAGARILLNGIPIGFIPIGATMDWFGTALPAGWVWANAQLLSRATYARLFAVYGTTFGVGDGATTFGTPDTRGRVVAGKDNMGAATSAARLTVIASTTLGGAGGEQTHLLTTTEMPAHAHSVYDPGHYHTGDGSNGYLYGINGGNQAYVLVSGHSHNTSTNYTGISLYNAGGGGAHNNVQPTIIANMIIWAGV